METPPELNATAQTAGGGWGAWLWMGALLVVTAGVIGFRYVGQLNDPAIASGASRARKPALLMFTADWCGPCQNFKATVLANPTVAARVQESFTFGKVDLTRQDPGPSEMARSYGVRGIPQLIITDASGKQIAKYSGPHDPQAFLRWLEGYAN